MLPARLCLTSFALLVACACHPKDDVPTLASTAVDGSARPVASGISAAASSAKDEERADAAFAAPTGTTLVDLDGASRPVAPIAPGVPRIAARAMLVPVHLKPSPNARKIGYLRAGAIAEAASPDSRGTEGCPGGWRAIVPAGFVCIGEKATLDLEDPIVRAVTRGPDPTQKLPYMYGVVTRGGPAYARIPTARDLDQFEPNLDKHLSKWQKDEVSGASYGLELWHKWRADKPTLGAIDALEQRVTESFAIPWYLKDGGSVPDLSGLAKPGLVKIGEVDRRQGAAFIESFLSEGRRYLVTTDLRVLPADRYRPIRGSDYHGVHIGTDVQLPFALIRRKGAKKWTYNAKKGMVDGGDLAWRSAVNLTGAQKFDDGVLHFETKEGFWVDDRHASRVDPAKRMPKWGKNGERWLDVNITKQVLVAYEGEKPVYATLVSAGEDGLVDGKKSTKKGIFRIHTKFVTTTMDSDVVGEEFELRDVPYVQYFEEGFALHGAYWHDGFGQPKSHGCINLSPEDARRLFYWTEPAVPPGWHGAALPLTGTVLFVHP